MAKKACIIPVVLLLAASLTPGLKGVVAAAPSTPASQTAPVITIPQFEISRHLQVLRQSVKVTFAPAKCHAKIRPNRLLDVTGVLDGITQSLMLQHFRRYGLVDGRVQNGMRVTDGRKTFRNARQWRTNLADALTQADSSPAGTRYQELKNFTGPIENLTFGSPPGIIPRL